MPNARPRAGAERVRSSPSRTSIATSAMPSETIDSGVPTKTAGSARGTPRPRTSRCSLSRVLGVVAGIELVGDYVCEQVRLHRDVGVEDDAAPQVAQVVVERGPRLVLDQLDPASSPVRELDQLGRARAQVVVDRLDERSRRLARNLERLGPRPGSARPARRCRAAPRRARGARPRSAPRGRARGGRRSSAPPRPRTRSSRRPAGARPSRGPTSWARSQRRRCASSSAPSSSPATSARRLGGQAGRVGRRLRVGLLRRCAGP